MTTKVSKASTDWLILKGHMLTRIDELHTSMENNLLHGDYHYCRGQIAALRALIDLVEPSAPPPTHEDNYEISTPVAGSY